MAAQMTSLPDRSTAMVDFKYKIFSEEVCRPVACTGGKAGLCDAILIEFSDVLPPTVAKEDIMLVIQDKSWDGVYVDLRQQTIPDRSHIKIVFRGPAENTKVPQPYSSCATAHAEPSTSVKPVISHGIQMHLGGSSSRWLELKSPDVQEAQAVDLESDKKLNEDQIKEMAVIYSKVSSRPLTEYHKHMNTAAQQLYLKNPALNDEARKKVLEEGFQFVNGKSRSKKEFLRNGVESKPKHQKMNQDIRDSRMKELEEIIKDNDERRAVNHCNFEYLRL